MKLRRCMSAFVLLITAIPVWAGSIDDGVVVTPASNLARDATEASRQGVAILLEFAADDCGYCRQLEEEFLKPMLRSGDYTDRVIMLELYSDSIAQLRDFNGKLISADKLIHRYNAGFAPTVVFLDSQGKEQAERLIGITTRDFYGGFLDEAIDESLRNVRKTASN